MSFRISNFDFFTLPLHEPRDPPASFVVQASRLHVRPGRPYHKGYVAFFQQHAFRFRGLSRRKALHEAG